MRFTALALLVALSAPLAVPAAAQEQQAGNAASTHADATFQKLIDQCDDVKALTLRARIRLLISRTTEDAAKDAQALLDQGFAQCGEGKMDEAMVTLNKALEVADTGTDKVFAAKADEAPAAPTETAANSTGAGEDKAPWWQFWKN